MVINKKIILKLFKEKKLEDYTIKLIKKYNIFYKILKNKDKELAIIDTVKKINNENRIVTSKNRKRIWEKGWLDINNNFKKKRSATSLIPQFYSKRKNLYFRLNGKFIKSSKFFEFNMIDIYRSWYFSKYLKNIDNIYEFGAGSGHNLIRLSDIFPKKKIYASDFSKNSVKLLKNVSNYKNYNWSCFQFNMKNINKKIILKENSAIFTSGSIEQLSGNIDNFIKFILKNKPRICIHIEPMPQLFNNNIEDFLSVQALKKKKYSINFLDKIKKLELNNKIKILKLLKSPFGSQLIDGMNLLVWKILR
jgi:hypothetical protein